MISMYESYFFLPAIVSNCHFQTMYSRVCSLLQGIIPSTSGNAWGLGYAAIDLRTLEFIARLSIPKIASTLDKCDIMQYHICTLHFDINWMYLPYLHLYMHVQYMQFEAQMQSICSPFACLQPCTFHPRVCWIHPHLVISSYFAEWSINSNEYIIFVAGWWFEPLWKILVNGIVIPKI